jgi:hypothetical protein
MKLVSSVISDLSDRMDDLQNIKKHTRKTKDWVTWTPQKTGRELSNYKPGDKSWMVRTQKQYGNDFFIFLVPYISICKPIDMVKACLF